MINKVQIEICLGSSCFSRGNNELVNIVKKYLKTHKLEDKVFFLGGHCSNLCLQGPNIRIDGKVINKISVDNIESVLNNNLKGLL